MQAFPIIVIFHSKTLDSDRAYEGNEMPDGKLYGSSKVCTYVTKTIYRGNVFWLKHESQKQKFHVNNV